MRLLERGKTSGRDDDNAESIKKRFRESTNPAVSARADLIGTFIETSMPVVDHYRKQGKVVEVSSAMLCWRVKLTDYRSTRPPQLISYTTRSEPPSTRDYRLDSTLQSPCRAAPPPSLAPLRSSRT